MEIQIRGNGVTIHDGLREFIERRTAKLDRLIDNVIDAKIELRALHHRGAGADYSLAGTGGKACRRAASRGDVRREDAAGPEAVDGLRDQDAGRQARGQDVHAETRGKTCHQGAHSESAHRVASTKTGGASPIGTQRNSGSRRRLGNFLISRNDLLNRGRFALGMGFRRARRA